MALYQFRHGDFTCTVILDGALAYSQPASILFSQVDPVQLVSALEPYNLVPDQWGQQILPNLCLLVEHGQQRVLIDTGSGPGTPTAGHLMAHLQVMGITPSMIDMVVLSHGHLDHSGGSLNSQGKPAFPNARYILAAAEWEFWMDQPDRCLRRINDQRRVKLVAQVRKNLQPLSPQLALVEDGDVLLPAMSAVVAPGHTPGQLAISILSKGEHFIYLADTVLHPLHMQQPHWVASVDVHPAECIRTRRRLLGQAAAHRALVHVYHFPFPGLGYVVGEGDGWRWQAVV